MDLHRIEILAGLLGIALGLALLIGIATSDSRKQAVRYLVPALVIAISSLALLDGYKTATQAQRVAIADGTYHITSITDDWLYLDTGGAFGLGVHKSDIIATHDSKDNVVVIEDGRPTAYVRSSPTRYVGDEFNLEYTRSGGVEAYIKGELGERQVQVDSVITHKSQTELVVDGDDVTLYLHQ